MSGTGDSGLEVGADELLAWLRAWAGALQAGEALLTELDAAIGDGDHGANMARGAARLAGLAADDGLAGLARAAGMALVSSVGGASGPLYGTFFLRFGAAAGHRDALDADSFAAAFAAGARGVADRGRSGAGDKTMLDVLLPAADALAGPPGAALPARLEAAEFAAASGLAATIPMVARKGRASYLGERSAGHQDPGATSSHLLVRAARRTLGAAQ